MKIKLNPPKKITWLISLVLAVIGLILFFIGLSNATVGIIAFLVELVAAGLVLAGNVVKGL
jgi:multisubunit Na+/H+ antiporter MnhB subunit